jgi:hypothetical protein
LQRATPLSKTGIDHGYGVVEAPPVIQTGWFQCMYFFVRFSGLTEISE